METAFGVSGAAEDGCQRGLARRKLSKRPKAYLQMAWVAIARSGNLERTLDWVCPDSG
jgi:hypothetical protein